MTRPDPFQIGHFLTASQVVGEQSWGRHLHIDIVNDAGEVGIDLVVVVEVRAAH